MTFFRSIETDHFKVKSSSGLIYLLVEKSLVKNSSQAADTSLQAAQKIYLVMGGGMAKKINDHQFYIVASNEIATRIPSLPQELASQPALPTRGEESP
ncbi:hypothetical protein [Pseudomonas sp. B329]|uniref:hypothetical protein n=1 Tax=Pseudomonas sp. B329 TaxID=1553459 RepID=UPI002004A0C5|nr:hypothetical protein [Pseudomonas sp. B329]MCK3863842.1 hypothetical protein [Pseudomonas sp. B329]